MTTELDFALKKIETLLKDYTKPPTAFKEDSWQNIYQMYTIPRKNSQHRGKLEVTEYDNGKDKSVLKYKGSRFALPNYNSFIEATVYCKDDLLKQPIKCTVSTKIAQNREDKPHKNSGLKKEIEYKNNKLIQKTDNTKQHYSLTGDYTCKWNLISVVQNISESDLPIEFTEIDEFDQLKPEHRLSVHNKLKVKINNNNILDLYSFQLTGQGTIPTVYYLDNNSRLLFIISGIEVYMLTGTEN